jgi:hypothetical protein
MNEFLSQNKDLFTSKREFLTKLREVRQKFMNNLSTDPNNGVKKSSTYLAEHSNLNGHRSSDNSSTTSSISSSGSILATCFNVGADDSSSTSSISSSTLILKTEQSNSPLFNHSIKMIECNLNSKTSKQ